MQELRCFNRQEICYGALSAGSCDPRKDEKPSSDCSGVTTTSQTGDLEVLRASSDHNLKRGNWDQSGKKNPVNSAQ